MTANTSQAGLQLIKTIADRALLADDGIDITCTSHGAAMNLRQRFNAMRAYERKRSQKELEFTNPAYGTSVYDSIETKILDDRVTLRFCHADAAIKALVIKDVTTGAVISPEDL